VLVSLQLYDQRVGGERSGAAIAEHLAWIRRFSTDSQLGLPYSWISDDGSRTDAPRGCDLALRISLMQQLQPAHADELYAHFVEHFWVNRWLGSGFAEWPSGSSGDSDADSGPVVLGIGFAASGFGIAAAMSAADYPRVRELTNALNTVSSLLGTFASIRPSTEHDLLQLSDEYETGFLLGDALLFYGLTWQSWAKPAGND
jgi:hypothetical protein